MKDSDKSEKGSIVIEAAIYIPFIIVIILAVFIYCALLYQQSVLQTVSHQVGEICSQQLRDSTYSKLVSTNHFKNVTFLDYSNHNPYRYLLNSDKNISRLENLVQELTKKSVIGSIENLSVNIYRVNYFVTNRYIVDIKQEIKSPIDLSLIGVANSFYLSEKCVITVTDPVEFIRNTDIAFDLINYIDEKTKVSETIKDIFDKAKSTFSR